MQTDGILPVNKLHAHLEVDHGVRVIQLHAQGQVLERQATCHQSCHTVWLQRQHLLQLINGTGVQPHSFLQVTLGSLRTRLIVSA